MSDVSRNVTGVYILYMSGIFHPNNGQTCTSWVLCNFKNLACIYIICLVSSTSIKNRHELARLSVGLHIWFVDILCTKDEAHEYGNWTEFVLADENLINKYINRTF